MLDETGLNAVKPFILPKNYHIGVYGTTREPYTGGLIRYAITDRTLFTPEYALRRLPRGNEGQAQLIRRCEELARLGVDFIQLREKDLPTDELVHLGKGVLAAMGAVGGHTRLLVNCDGDVSAALSIGADGVHLTSRAQVVLDQVVRLFAEAGLRAPYVSVSCHSVAEVQQAKAAGASAILFGPVFGKSVRGEQVQEGVGLQRLAEACADADAIPVLALGGVTESNAEVCLDAGAAGIAAIRLFMLP